MHPREGILRRRRSSRSPKRGSQAGSLQGLGTPGLPVLPAPLLPTTIRALNLASSGTQSSVVAAQSSVATFACQFTRPELFGAASPPGSLPSRAHRRCRSGRRGEQAPVGSSRLPRLPRFPRDRHAATGETRGLGTPVPRPSATAREAGSRSRDRGHGRRRGPALAAGMKTHHAHDELSTAPARGSNPPAQHDAGGHGLRPAHANPVAASSEDAPQPRPKTMEELRVWSLQPSAQAAARTQRTAPPPAAARRERPRSREPPRQQGAATAPQHPTSVLRGGCRDQG